MPGRRHTTKMRVGTLVSILVVALVAGSSATDHRAELQDVFASWTAGSLPQVARLGQESWLGESDIVSLPLQVQSSAAGEATAQPETWDPHGLLNAYGVTTTHSLGVDSLGVWTCGATPDTTADYVAMFTNDVTPWYAFHSRGRYQPVFAAGGAVLPGASPVDLGDCMAAVEAAAPEETFNGAIVVFPGGGGSGGPGWNCGTEGCPPELTMWWPDNSRDQRAGHWSPFGEPLDDHLVVTVIHELGHMHWWPHSPTGNTGDDYDNPMDVMSWPSDGSPPRGTIAINLYAAGWIDPDEVVVGGPDPQDVSLSTPAIGGTTTRMLVIPDGNGFYALGPRAAGEHDYLPSPAYEGVEVYRVTMCGACLGYRTAVPDPAEGGSSHVLQVGESIVLSGTVVEVTGTTPGAYDVHVGPSPVTRYAGSDRYSTAAEISANDFPDPESVDTVFVAVGSNFPDALAGAAVAGALGAPLLLVTGNSIPAPTAAELSRLEPDTVVILGGSAVVSPGVEVALGGYAPSVDRLAGANRYATSVAISGYGYPGGADQVFIATGLGFADALTGGPAAAHLGGPMLLTDPTSLPQVVADEIARLGPDRIVVVGGTAAVSDTVLSQLQAIQPSTERLSGVDRYATAVAISAEAFGDPGAVDRVYVSTGVNFPDALAGAAAAGWYGAPILLVPGSSIPGVVADEVERLGPTGIVVLGGTAVVSTGVQSALADLIL